MLLRKPVQAAVNIIVIVLVVALIGLGLAMALPLKKPLGTLMGKMGNQKRMLSGLVSGMDPKAVAQAINENPGFLAGLIEELSDPEDLEATAQAINQNPDFLGYLLQYLDPQVIAGVINGHGEFLSRLVGKLDPAALAKAVNSNPDFNVKMMKYLDPQVIAGVINRNGAWLTGLLPYLDTAVLAAAMNANPDFTVRLVSFLDPYVIASAINANGGFLTSLLALLDPAAMTQGINQNPRFLSGLIGSLDASVLAGALNANPQFMVGMMARMDARNLVSALNQNQDFIFQVTNYMDPVTAGAIASDQAFLTRMLSLINPAPIAAAINANPNFLKTMMAHTSADAIARILSDNGYALSRVAEYINLDYLKYLALDEVFMRSVISVLDPGVMARVTNANPDFMIRLNSQMPANVARELALALNDCPGIIDTALQHLDPAKLAAAMNNHPELNRTVAMLLSGLPGSSAVPDAVADALNNPATQPFIDALIGKIAADPQSAELLAQAMNENPDFMVNLLRYMDTNLAERIGQALNANPNFLITLVSKLNKELGKAMAEGTNLNTQMMPALLRALSPHVAEKVAKALDTNPALLTNLISNLNADAGRAMAEGSNNANPDFMANIMRYLSPETGQALANGLNNAQQDFLTNLLTHLDANAGKAMGKGINGMAASGALTAMLDGSEAHTVEAIAQALEANPNFLNSLLAGMTDGVAGLAAGINAGINAAPMYMLQNNLHYTDASIMAAIMNSPAGKELVNRLIGKDVNPGDEHLSGALVAQALNSGAGLQTFLPKLMANLNTIQMAQVLNQYGQAMNLALTKGLDAARIAAAVNNSIDPSIPGNAGSLLRNMGVGIFMQARIDMGLFFLDMDVYGMGVVKQLGTGALPGDPNAPW